MKNGFFCGPEITLRDQCKSFMPQRWKYQSKWYWSLYQRSVIFPNSGREQTACLSADLMVMQCLTHIPPPITCKCHTFISGSASPKPASYSVTFTIFQIFLYFPCLPRSRFTGSLVAFGRETSMWRSPYLGVFYTRGVNLLSVESQLEHRNIVAS